MGIVDIIILICFLPAVYFGIRNGLVRQLISLCVIFFGIKLSLQFSPTVSSWLTGQFEIKEYIAKIISFSVIFIAISILFSLVGKLVDKIIQITLLGWLNRIAGIILSLALFALVISVVIYIFDTVNTSLQIVDEAKIAESKFYSPLLDLAKEAFPHIKEAFPKIKEIL